MQRFFATVLNLALMVSLVLTGTACSCAIESAEASETSAAAEATAAAGQTSETAGGEASHECCGDESSEHDEKSDDGCCDAADCSLTARDSLSELSTFAQLSDRDPTADLPAVASTLYAIPAAWTLDILEGLDQQLTSPVSSGHSPAISAASPRYLVLQVLRL